MSSHAAVVAVLLLALAVAAFSTKTYFGQQKRLNRHLDEKNCADVAAEELPQHLDVRAIAVGEVSGEDITDADYPPVPNQDAKMLDACFAAK